MDLLRELSRLNPRQKEAVMHTEGPLLILAGAGSGKTRVITVRTANLIYKGVKAESILAVTFTNKAAREMRERVTRITGNGKRSPHISTFHSLCLRILRQEIEHLGYRKDFSIYDTSDQVSLLRNILSDTTFYGKDFRTEAVLERISRTKNDFSPSDGFSSDDKADEAAELVYPRYSALLRSMNALDFDDLLLLTLRLFREHPDILAKYRERFRYIMVDEYQDTNRVQYRFIRLLAGEKGNLCVVGDDDQSIYGWRGAHLGNILDFERDFPGTVTVRLEQNYRSFDHILKAANSVIQNNRRRMEKTLWTKRGPGPKVNVFRATDTEDEAEWVAERIMLMKEKNTAYEDIAVIYRANNFSRPFEEALRMKRIPYSVVGGTSYFERREIRDMVSYLKIIANPSDNLSLLRAVQAPKRGLGPSALNAMSDFARSCSVPLLNAFGRAAEIPGLGQKALRSAEDFFQLVNHYRDMFGTGRDLGGTLRMLLDEIGYRDYIVSLYKTPEAGYRRLENLDGFIDSFVHYESVEPAPSLHGFLETMALTDLMEEKDDTGGKGVTLISFHSSKGLEFPAVFIVGAEEDILPHKKSAETAGGVEEERRLFYVGITRAKNELCITHTDHRRRYGKEVPSLPSRFLEEIPGDVTATLDRFEKMDPEEEKAYVKSLYENFMARFSD